MIYLNLFLLSRSKYIYVALLKTTLKGQKENWDKITFQTVERLQGD